MIYLAAITLILLAYSGYMTHLYFTHMKEQIDAKDNVIARQQETIEKTHTRLVLPIEQAAVDVRNQDEHVQQPTATMMYPEEFPQSIPVLSTSPTELPRDLDTPPDAL